MSILLIVLGLHLTYLPQTSIPLIRPDEISAPTLVMAGGEDMEDFRLIAEMLAGGIPGAQKVTIPGVGRLVNLEAPRRSTRRWRGL